MFFFPINTDAPIYHFPVATIGLIVVNTVVFARMLWGGDPDAALPWILWYGEGLHPLQWVTSAFLHADFFHLLGNMMFLWAFGLVVEGKLGWWRFLLAYLGIGIVESAVEQTIMLGADGGGSLGASSILFGLMAMAMVWAPKNDLNFVMVIFIFIVPRVITFDMSILTCSAVYLGLQIVFAWLTGFSMSTPMLHLMGAAVGLPLGIALFKLRWVDCEGWDLFTVWRGEAGRRSWESGVVVDEAAVRERIEQKAADTRQRIDQLLQQGQGPLALAVHRKATGEIPGWQLAQPQLAALIKAVLARKECQTDAIPLLVDYLQRFPNNTTRVRLKLAELLLRDDHPRPAQALRVLSKLTKELPAPLDKTRRELIARAERLRDRGPIELAPEDW